VDSSRKLEPNNPWTIGDCILTTLEDIVLIKSLREFHFALLLQQIPFREYYRTASLSSKAFLSMAKDGLISMMRWSTFLVEAKD
jgi:hypothetical protein